MNPINDIVLASGISRLTALERSNLAVAQRLQSFSASNPLPDEDPVEGTASPAALAAAPDMGYELVTLTRNAMAYSMISRAISNDLGLYAAVISEGKG